jgi:hypothetical protein
MNSKCYAKGQQWKVLRDQAVAREQCTVEPEPLSKPKASATWDFLLDDTDVPTSDDDDLASFNTLLNKKEEAISSPAIVVSQSNVSKLSSTESSASQWYIESFDEPFEELEDDSGHISIMVQNYLKDEEDENVRSIVGNYVGKACEEDEDCEGDADSDDDNRISKSDAKSKVELAYTRRVSLVGRQVLRYAYGGTPLWCTLPAPSPAIEVPRCEFCGCDRVFEAQLMPGMLQYMAKLHPVHAEDEATHDATEGLSREEIIARRREHLRTQGGYDFGVVAVWSCQASCVAGPTEFCVMQPPADSF